jgi:hypothetical protein
MKARESLTLVMVVFAFSLALGSAGVAAQESAGEAEWEQVTGAETLREFMSGLVGRGAGRATGGGDAGHG